MKKILFPFVLFALVFITGCKKEPLALADFAITSSTYDYLTDWEQIVEDEFGEEYRCADWRDLVRYFDEGGDLLELFDNLGLPKGVDVTIKYKGVKNYTIERGYFAVRHEHNKPTGFLAHDDIDDYLITLGSWSGSRKIMAVRK